MLFRSRDVGATGGVRNLRRNESHFWAEEIVIQIEQDALPPEISGAFLYHQENLSKFPEIQKRSFFQSECHAAPDSGQRQMICEHSKDSNGSFLLGPEREVA